MRLSCSNERGALQDDYRVSQGIVDKLVVFQVFGFTVWTITAMVMGLWVVQHFAGASHSHLARTSKPKSLTALEIISALTIFLASVLCLFVYLDQIQEVALISALTGPANGAWSIRSAMGSAFFGKFHWYKVLMGDLASVVTFAFFAHWLLRKRSVWRFSLFFICFIHSAFVSVMATEKAPFAWLLIALFVVYTLVECRGRYPIKKFLVLVGIIFLTLIPFYVFFMGSKSVGNAMSAIISRTFSGSITPAYFYLEYFPRYHEFLLGRTFPNIGGLLPLKPYNVGFEVMNWVHPERAMMGIRATMPTVYWADLYANFGTYGVASAPFFVGMILGLLQLLTRRLCTSALGIGLFVWALLHYKDLSVSAMWSYVFDFYAILVMVVVGGVYYINIKITRYAVVRFGHSTEKTSA